jgi:energy-coupling factor transporter ATP-binding protein EcfA2
LNPHIKKALLNGRLVLLFGAGASKGCKNKLNQDIPLGGELADILAKEMGEEIDGEELSEVYSAARVELGGQVDTIFERHFKHCTPSIEYEELLKYPFFRIYSLNIDDAFETAAYRNRNIKFNVLQRNDNITEIDQFYKTIDYIKLNGDVNRVADGFVFSAQEYGSGSANEPLWYSELARDYHKYTFIFIGTKLKEPLFYHQIEKFKAKTGSTDLKSYILIPSLTNMQKKGLSASNIHHLEGKLGDFTTWLTNEFESPPTSSDVVMNTRPELKNENIENGKNLPLFSGVTPVNRSSLTLMERSNTRSEIRNFYKGFKPTWFDVMDDVPALLSQVKNFYFEYLYEDKPCPLELYLILGSAGCGKSTALKQLALKVADEGSRNVYFVEEHKDNFLDLIHELDYRNDNPYYLFIERIGDLAAELSEILKKGKSSKAIIVTSENPKIWKTRVREKLHESVTKIVDISHIKNHDADLILAKIKQYGNWTRLERMSERDRRKELIQKSKNQLLIGLIEATSGEGYDKIIQKDYKSITSESEKALLILAGLATTQRVPASEATLTRALSYLGLNSNVFYLSSNMDGIVQFSNGSVTTRHRIYIEKLFNLYVPRNELLNIISAYIRSFSVYKFPLAKNLNRNEFTIYKHLVNNKSLKRILKDNKKNVLTVYESFEKAFENEGLFLMQYGLALRSFDENEQAYEKLRIAEQAFPESPHIEHALAQQRIILACNENDETIAMAYFSDAEFVLNRLNSAAVKSNVNAVDHYPIITLSEGHVQVLDNLGYKNQARIIAKQYYDRISRSPDHTSNVKINETASKLMKYAFSGKWPDKNKLND